MEELSRAYVHAVSARVGYRFYKIDPDFDKVDARLDTMADDPSEDLSIRIQLKSTTEKRIRVIDDHIHYYDLDPETYNRIVTRKDHDPIILILLILPDDDSKWLEHDPNYLIERKCAYWINLTGCSKIDGKSVTVKIPLTNTISPDGLIDLVRTITKV